MTKKRTTEETPLTWHSHLRIMDGQENTIWVLTDSVQRVWAETWLPDGGLEWRYTSYVPHIEGYTWRASPTVEQARASVLEEVEKFVDWVQDRAFDDLLSVDVDETRPRLRYAQQYHTSDSILNAMVADATLYLQRDRHGMWHLRPAGNVKTVDRARGICPILVDGMVDSGRLRFSMCLDNGFPVRAILNNRVRGGARAIEEAST